MHITFPDSPPTDPMDGDYLLFEAAVYGKPVKCVITFDSLTPGKNDPEKAIRAFDQKKDQIHATARAMIEAGQVGGGEIVITRLKAVEPEAERP